ncbi:MAG: type III pantothenate kinase [Chlamydiae bacterium]|nr:type III pantothenate kinase [Chlamydiota bacterium]
MAHLVLDIGNFRVKGAFFKEENVKNFFSIPKNEDLMAQLTSSLEAGHFDKCLISSVNEPVFKQIRVLFQKKGWPFILLKSSDIKIELKVDEPEALGSDRIANVYGALHHFPQNDCIVVDIGTAVTFDCISKAGQYVGGAIYPGPEIGAKALANYTDKLPHVTPDKPLSALGKTTETHIQSGLYWGLLGAIERIVAELRMTANSPSSVKILATGGSTRIDVTDVCQSKVEFVNDLKDLVDFVDPYLTLVGLHEILKEIMKVTR